MLRFSTIYPILMEHEFLQPQYMRPEWFKQLKSGLINEGPAKTAKTCPGFVSMFRCCIVMPLWADIRLTRGFIESESKEFIPDPDGTFLAPTSSPEYFGLENHHWEQVGPCFPGSFGMELLPKPVCPWLLETDPGWSIFVMPATLHGRQLPWEPIPGIFNTDNWHQLNMPCRYTRNPEVESTIFKGTPFAYFLPFKRDEDPGAIDLRLLDDKEEWERIHGEPDSADYNDHLITSYGRAPN